jgi:hypothetical protein
VSTSTPEPEVTPRLGPSGKPVRRRGRWTYVSHQWNGPVWRLDGTTLDLEHDPSCHSVCVGGDRCNGAWILNENGRYKEPVGEYLDESMDWVEQEHDRAAGQAAATRAPRPPVTPPAPRSRRPRVLPGGRPVRAKP